MGTRRKARECALQMLFAADVAKTSGEVLTRNYWAELGEQSLDEETSEFANRLAVGTLREVEKIDHTIRTRAEHWRIERMAIVDRNVLRLAVYEFLFSDTPHTVIINEANFFYLLPVTYYLLEIFACQPCFTTSILKKAFLLVRGENFATKSSSRTIDRRRISLCDCRRALELFFDIQTN
jgi:N utilization substance protein B